MRKLFIIYMGKQLEKLILILGMIVLGSITLAQPPVDTLSGDNTPIIERKRKAPKVEKETKQNPETPKQDKQTENKPTQKGKKKIQQKPQFLGLKIYDNGKPKKQPTEKYRYSCGTCYSVKKGTFRCKDWELYYTDGKCVKSRDRYSFRTHGESKRHMRKQAEFNKNYNSFVLPEFVNNIEECNCKELLKNIKNKRTKNP